MWTVTAKREYRSPLRDEQSRRTRCQILDALVDLVTEQGAADLAIRDLAARAGVSQRTVYRHFPDRQALLDGLVDHISEQAEWSELDDIEGDITRLPDRVHRAWSTFDEFERQTRVLVLLNRDPARLATSSVARGRNIDAALATTYPDLSPRDSRGIAGVIRLLASSHSWLRFRDEFDMTADEGAHYIKWALDLVVGELSRGNYPTSDAAVGAGRPTDGEA